MTLDEMVLVPAAVAVVAINIHRLAASRAGMDVVLDR